MNRRTMIAVGAALALAAGGAGAAVAVGGGDDGEGGATGPGADRARDAALALYPGARANAVERDGEDGATWEVEISQADGDVVDVRLDEDLGLVVAEGDSEAQDNR
jgi:uncharacterized membrane protein YkoI